MRLHLEQPLARAPEIQVDVESAIAVVEHALHERGLEVAEPAIGQPGDAPERGRGGRAAHLDVDLDLARHAQRVALEQPVDIVQVEPEQLHPKVAGGLARDLALGDLRVELLGLDLHDVYGLLQHDTLGVAGDGADVQRRVRRALPGASPGWPMGGSVTSSPRSCRACSSSAIAD